MEEGWTGYHPFPCAQSHSFKNTHGVKAKQQDTLQLSPLAQTHKSTSVHCYMSLATNKHAHKWHVCKCNYSALPKHKTYTPYSRQRHLCFLMRMGCTVIKTCLQIVLLMKHWKNIFPRNFSWQKTP